MTTIDLRISDLRNLKPGIEVISQKGFAFTFLGKTEQGKEIWLDQTSGLKWFEDDNGEGLNWYQSMEKFNSPEKRLPSKEEFELAEKHGFRDVLPKIEGYRWSSSVHPYYAAYAYGFNGSYGGIDYGNRDSSYVNAAALCVGR